jgi:hypothetical protein
MNESTTHVMTFDSGAGVRRRGRRRITRAVAGRVVAGAAESGLDVEARTEALATALADCLFREIRARFEPSGITPAGSARAEETDGDAD